MKQAKSILKKIKAQGFSHIKVELEGTLRRTDKSNVTSTACTDCDTGRAVCPSDCQDGVQVMPGTNGLTQARACLVCSGMGYRQHDACRGRGYTVKTTGYDFSDTSVCEDFLDENMSKETVDAINYKRFYYDGSVDSEYTFTIPVEEAWRVPEVIRAFKKLADENGGGLDVAGAGMHIAVLAEGCDGRYPVDTSLNSDKLANFKSEVTKLLPAMFLLASGGNYSRPFRFRAPQITNQKYSAIHVLRGCLEFRLFETCYDRPEAVYEFFGVISKALEFYDSPEKKVARMGKTYIFTGSKGVQRYVKDAESVEILKKQLTYLRPAGLRIKDIEETRCVKLSVIDARKKHMSKVKELTKLYLENERAYSAILNQPMSRRQEEVLNELREENRRYDEGWTEEYMKRRAFGLYDELPTLANFIKKAVAGSGTKINV